MRRLERLAFFLPLLGFPLLLLRLEETREGILQGLKLCGELLIPSLFPFSVLANTLLRMGMASRLEQRLQVPVCAVPWALGLLGGFPLGAQSLAALYRDGAITRQEAIRAACWCNNPGAAFFIGTVGTVLGDPKLGLLLLGIQLTASLSLALLLSQGRGKSTGTRRRVRSPQPLSGAFTGALGDSALAMVRLCGSVCFFLALWRALEGLLPSEGLPQIPRALLLGAAELSSGTAALGLLPRDAAFALAAGLTGWGGLCVHLQAADALCGEGLPLIPYVLGKLCQGLLASLLAWWILRFGLLSALLPTGGFAAGLIFFRNRQKRRWKKQKPVV